jgi:hypothetical protein
LLVFSEFAKCKPAIFCRLRQEIASKALKWPLGCPEERSGGNFLPFFEWFAVSVSRAGGRNNQ